MSGGIINPAYIAKLSERQQRLLKAGAIGRKFFYEFIYRHGNHVFNLCNTGGGKTQRNYWLVDWLKFTENIIWISTGKSDEILPLFFMGCKVRIIKPKDAEFEISGCDLLENPPEIIEVQSPGEVWHQILRPDYDEMRHKVYKKITILEFRNTLSPDIRSDWMAELFTLLAEWSRDGTMPHIFPCAIFIDESQWVLAGTRITTDQKRGKTSEIITENVLEMRSKGCRVVFSAQDFKNVTPASRENMLNAILGRGANVPAEENREWARACGDARTGVKSTTTFSREFVRFVFDDGRFYSPGDHPADPWKFPRFPESDEDREKLNHMEIRYGRKFSGLTEEEESTQECLPELGRFSALAIKPEIQEMVESRWNLPAGEIENG